MLDLNFVRENLDQVRKALGDRNFAPDALDKFVELDIERRKVIAEADEVNRKRNMFSKEIGLLIQAGKKDEASTIKSEVSGIKERQTILEKLRDDADLLRRLHSVIDGEENVQYHEIIRKLFFTLGS